MKKDNKDIESLSKPLNSDVDHLAILAQLYDMYMETGNDLSNLMKYYLNGLDVVPTTQVESLWNKSAFRKKRRLFEESYPELLEILQNDYQSFKYNFNIIRFTALNAIKFKEYPLWSEYYDFDELNEIEEWGFDKDSILKELVGKEIEGQHPYYTAPISSFPLIRMRYFTRATFRTINGIELDGAIMNEGESVIKIFIGDEMESLSNHPMLSKMVSQSLMKVANHFQLDVQELKNLRFETVIPMDKEKRIKGNWRIENET